MNEDSFSTAAETAREYTDKAQDQAHQAAGQFRDQAQQVAGQVRDQAQRAFSQGDDYVRENPWTVVLGAAGLGLLVGFALAQRHEPTLRERYVDEPLDSARDLLYSILSPVASRVQKEYGNARSAIEEAADQLKGVDPAKHANRAARKLRFW